MQFSNWITQNLTAMIYVNFFKIALALPSKVYEILKFNTDENIIEIMLKALSYISCIILAQNFSAHTIHYCEWNFPDPIHS